MIEAKRTAEVYFQNLPNYDFKEHFLYPLEVYPDLRMHYLDEGDPHSEQVFLCLHGQPTWSYLYRKMIPVFLEAGVRVIAPDLLGFGKSDKPIEESVYTFNFHRNSLIALLEKLDLKNVTLVCQDWGGLLGLTIPMDMPERFQGLLVMNTMLATGTYDLGDGFRAWLTYNNKHPDLDIESLLRRSCSNLSAAEAKAYAAPFPDSSYKAGVRVFPNLVCAHPEAEGAELSRRAKEFWKTEWNHPSFMAVGAQDPVIPPIAMHGLAKIIKGCPEPKIYASAGHFVQECGDEVAKDAMNYFSSF